MTTYMIQPSAYTDQITDEGQELQRLPYPFYADETGAVQRQDFWHDKVSQIVGFVGDPARQEIHLTWRDALARPDEVPGKYVVTCDARGNFSTHVSAVSAFKEITE